MSRAIAIARRATRERAPWTRVARRALHVHEHQGAEIMKKFGVRVPIGAAAFPEIPVGMLDGACVVRLCRVVP